MGDNASSINAIEYDENINRTIPYYDEFHKQTIDVVQNMEYQQIKWLDIGCGTGTLTARAAETFQDAHFLLADPSPKMIEQAKCNMQGKKADFRLVNSIELYYDNQFQVVTAIQAHHYMKNEERKEALANIYQALQAGGIFIAFENIIPDSEILKALELERWGKYQLRMGKSEQEVETHKSRCGQNYFPLTVQEHIKLLTDSRFQYVNVFWRSYMQMGIYAIK
jgi:tRNA (cmo5U34)-methyltransferase